MTSLSTRNRILMPSLGLVLLALLAVPALGTGYKPAFAKGDPARSAVGSDLVIAKGESVAGDVSVTSGNLFVNGTVNGDAIVVGGSAEITGSVTGNVYVVGGNVTLRSTGSVGGEVDYSGGKLVREPGATVGGSVNQNQISMFGLGNSVADSASDSPDSVAHSWRTPFEHIGTLFGWGLVSLVVLAISIVLAVVAPLRVRIASATLVAEGRPSAMLGLIIGAVLAPLTGGNYRCADGDCCGVGAYSRRGGLRCGRTRFGAGDYGGLAGAQDIPDHAPGAGCQAHAYACADAPGYGYHTLLDDSACRACPGWLGSLYVAAASIRCGVYRPRLDSVEPPRHVAPGKTPLSSRPWSC